MAGLFDLLTSGGLGAVIGAAGSWLTKREERRAAKDTYRHEEEMSRLRSQERIVEAQHQAQVAETEGAYKLAVAEAEAFKTGLLEQTKTYGIWIIDALKGLMRPLATIYMMVLSTWLAINVYELVGGLSAMPDDQVMALFTQIVQEILFLNSTAVTWWFGSRPSAQRPSKLT